MSIESFQNYNGYLRYMNSAVNIWGQTCTIFIPKQQVTLGYENLNKSLEQETGVSGIANPYTVVRKKVYIDFQPTKSVFYHFNFFPEDSDELVLAYMTSNSQVRENAFIRTAVPDQVSIWGDQIYQIKYIKEDGKFQLLKRTYFLKPVSDAQLSELLKSYSLEGGDAR